MWLKDGPRTAGSARPCEPPSCVGRTLMGNNSSYRRVLLPPHARHKGATPRRGSGLRRPRGARVRSARSGPPGRHAAPTGQLSQARRSVVPAWDTGAAGGRGSSPPPAAADQRQCRRRGGAEPHEHAHGIPVSLDAHAPPVHGTPPSRRRAGRRGRSQRQRPHALEVRCRREARQYPYALACIDSRACRDARHAVESMRVAMVHCMGNTGHLAG